MQQELPDGYSNENISQDNSEIKKEEVLKLLKKKMNCLSKGKFSVFRMKSKKF